MVKICAGISVDHSGTVAIRQKEMLCGNGSLEELDGNIRLSDKYLVIFSN
jgi:hypothetical protein